MALKFCANISTLFEEVSIIERYAKAKSYGFTAVEMQFPYECEINALKVARETSGLEHVLLNSPSGDENEFGLGALLMQEFKFFNSMHEAVSYATALRCGKIHILAGLLQEGFTENDQTNIFIPNLSSAADMLDEHNLMCLIEPLCKEVKENYFLSSYDKAVEIIEAVNRPNLKLLLDVYHLHKITGDAVGNIDKYYKYAGHIQVSQDPSRCEPMFPGNIDYEKIFKFLKKMNHKDYIGLEYFPSEPNNISFQWIEDLNK